MEGVPASRNYQGGFAVSHMLKDLRLAIDSGSKLPLWMGKEALHMYEKVSQPVRPCHTREPAQQIITADPQNV